MDRFTPSNSSCGYLIGAEKRVAADASLDFGTLLTIGY
jgi:hypothetical protein